ncbi:protein kinase domain-containing protein [Planctomicrobium sp. SH668]|uniref:serine/threonine protein kinase n=1 Tax=Planctomicrobium sp. SH668 TaxID=3448126 RepID=UPI003F5BCB20
MADSDNIDDYELLNCVATGSATQIWEVRKGGSTQTQAMKILLPEAFKDAEAKKNLKHEANVGKSLEHPNIIRIQDFKMTRQHGYYVMEYFRGGNIKSSIRNDRAQVQAKAKRITECMAQALAHMHDKKWIHKDVKPDNILFTKGGEVRLIDFSLASRAGSAVVHAISKKSNILIQGTRTYLAPELIRREVLTHSVDIYSLGVTLYEMMTGVPPFRTANPNDLLMMHVRDRPVDPSAHDDNITPDADKFILKLLGKRPKERPATMNEVFAEARSLNFFKVDPLEHARVTREKFLASDAQMQNDRLDSRMDAKRTAEGGNQEAQAKPKKKIVVPLPEPMKPAKQPAAAAPVPAQPHSGSMNPFPQPNYPGMFPGGGMMPGMGMPPGMQMPNGQMPGMPPGYPMQPGMPGQFPGYPGMPGQFPGMQMQYPPVPGQQYPGMPPGQPYPGMPMPGMPVPGMPQAGFPGAVPQPQVPQPAPPVPVAPKPAPTQSAVPAPAAPKPAESITSLDDLDIM